MKYCTKCGTPKEMKNGKFCNKCGYEFPVQSTHPLNLSAPNQSDQSVKKLKKGKNIFVGIAILSCILALILAIALFTGTFSHFFTPDDSEKEAYSREDKGGDTDRDEDEKDKPSDSTDHSGIDGFISGLVSIFGAEQKESDATSSATEPIDSDATSSATASENPDTTPINTSVPLEVWSTREQMQQVLDSYVSKALPDLQCEFVFIPYESFDERIRISMASSEMPDVLTLDQPYPKILMEQGALLDLSSLENTALSNGTIGYTVDYGRDSYGTLRALAMNLSPGAMFYRRSYAAKYLGTDDPNKVQSMFSDLNSLYNTAGTLYKNSDGKCKVTSLNDLIIPSMSLRSNPWVLNGRLLIEDSLIDFLNTYTKMLNNSYLSTFRQWDDNWYAGISDGAVDSTGTQVEVFSYFLPKWGLDYILKQYATAAHDTTEDWAMIQGPFNYFMGGTWLCADANTRNPEAAKELIEYITLDTDFLKEWAGVTKDIVPNYFVNEMVQSDGMDTFVKNQNTYQLFNDICRNIDGTIYSGYDKEIESLWIKNIDSYVNGVETLDDALVKFRNEAEASCGIN